MTREWPEDECPTTPRLSPFTVVAPNRPPCLPVLPLPVHEAKTVVIANGAGLLRAADADRRNSR